MADGGNNGYDPWSMIMHISIINDDDDDNNDDVDQANDNTGAAHAADGWQHGSPQPVRAQPILGSQWLRPL